MPPVVCTIFLQQFASKRTMALSMKLLSGVSFPYGPSVPFACLGVFIRGKGEDLAVFIPG